MEQFYSLLMLFLFQCAIYENDPLSVDLIIFVPKGICSEILVERKGQFFQPNDYLKINK